MYLKKHITYLLLLVSFSAMAQLKNFGTKAKYKPEPNYRYSVYGYYDMVREIGVGVQLQIRNKWNLDASVYNVRSSEYYKMQISQWDYHDFKGYGFSFKPKWLLGPMNRFYVGLNLACEYLKHDIIWVNYSAVGDHYNLFVLKSANGYAFNLGSTIGIKQHIKQLFIEPFLTIGLSIVDMKSTIYDARGAVGFLPNEPYPYTVSSSSHNGSYIIENKFLHFNIGIKAGFSFKSASQKREAINKKFDEVYIPKTDSLTKKFQSINYRRPYLFEAFNNYQDLNRHALLKYRWYYGDTVKLYKAISVLFKDIDDLILQHNEIKAAVDSAYGKRKEAFEIYFKTVNVNEENTPSKLKKAYRRYRGLDRLILRYYGAYKNNKKVFYKKIDHHFYNIDKLILLEKK